MFLESVLIKRDVVDNLIKTASNLNTVNITPQNTDISVKIGTE